MYIQIDYPGHLLSWSFQFTNWRRADAALRKISYTKFAENYFESSLKGGWIPDPSCIIHSENHQHLQQQFGCFGWSLHKLCFQNLVHDNQSEAPSLEHKNSSYYSNCSYIIKLFYKKWISYTSYASRIWSKNQSPLVCNINTLYIIQIAVT